MTVIELICFLYLSKLLEFILWWDKSHVLAGLCGAVLVTWSLWLHGLFLGQHLRLEDSILEDSILD